jgi:hypothetical protein
MTDHLATNEIDEKLGRYFKGEMPNPWPPCPTSRTVHTPSYLRVTRWAVAASIGLLLAGYLALAGFFPRESTRLDQDPSRGIGQHPRPSQK